MEVPSESFHRSSWDSRTCYPRRAFNQGLTDAIMWERGLVGVSVMNPGHQFPQPTAQSCPVAHYTRSIPLPSLTIRPTVRSYGSLHSPYSLTQHQAFTPQCCRLKPWSCWARGLSGSMVGYRVGVVLGGHGLYVRPPQGDCTFTPLTTVPFVHSLHSLTYARSLHSLPHVPFVRSFHSGPPQRQSSVLPARSFHSFHFTTRPDLHPRSQPLRSS